MMYTWNDYYLHDLAPRYPKLFPIEPEDVCLNALPYEMSAAGLAFHKTFIEGCEATESFQQEKAEHIQHQKKR